MADYHTLKVTELKKLLHERSLPSSGNKSDLISRLEEHDKNSSEPAAGAPASKSEATEIPEDEIKYDDDTLANAPKTKAPDTSAVPAPTSKQPPKGDAATSKKPSTDTSELLPEATSKTASASQEPKDQADLSKEAAENFSAGLEKTELERELEKRRKRAAKFGIAENDTDAEKAVARAKKFGGMVENSVTTSLDQALPERSVQKRGRGGGGGKDGGDDRAGKREKLDKDGQSKAQGATRRDQDVGSKATNGGGGKKGVLDDPLEREKAERRAKKFGLAS